MSDPVVIALVKSRLEAILAVDEPVLETINARPRLTPKFVSIERDYSAVDRVTLSSPLTQFRETGTISIVVNVQSGTGTAVAEELAERVRDAFHNYASGQFQVMTVGSAVVFEPDDGNYFQMKVPVQYMFDFFK